MSRVQAKQHRFEDLEQGVLKGVMSRPETSPEHRCYQVCWADEMDIIGRNLARSGTSV